MEAWMPGMEPWMLDDDSAWWAKLRRADAHRETVAALVTKFRAGDPYTLTPEPVPDKPHVVAYRLHIRRQVDADISTAIGDVLHNLRSALDSLAYELAVQSVGPLSKRKERATEFPICESAETYGEFFGDSDSPSDSQRLRGRIYDARARKAMFVAQPFYWASMGGDVNDEERRKPYREEFEWSEVRRLREMHSIDKHRRLNVTTFWPDLFSWGSNEGDNTGFRWSGVVANGEILCYLIGPKAAQTDLQHDFALVLADDPMHRPFDGPYVPGDCLKLLEGCSQSVWQKIASVLGEYTRLGQVE